MGPARDPAASATDHRGEETHDRTEPIPIERDPSRITDGHLHM
jgi:hypothetical protein